MTLISHILTLPMTNIIAQNHALNLKLNFDHFRTCRAWNENGCSKPGKDENHCGYGADALRHGCSMALGPYSLCWDKTHKEREHR